MTDKIQTGTRLPIDLYKEIKRVSSRTNKSINQIIIEAVQKHISDLNNEFFDEVFPPRNG